MVRANKLPPQKHWKCFFCQKQTPFQEYSFYQTKQIGNQQFYFYHCSKCQGLNYFWTVNKQYFFDRKVHLVLYEPEIIGNVGSVIRLAVAFNLQLHLIEPFGFIFSENWLKRSSANNLNLVKIRIYADWNEFQKINLDGVFILTSAHGKISLSQFNFLNIERPIYLIFGRESRGLPDNLKKQHQDKLLYLQQNPVVRSLNLANVVGIFTFFVLHQYQSIGL